MKTFKKILRWLLGSCLAIILLIAIAIIILYISTDIEHKKVVKNMSEISVLPKTELIYVANDYEHILGFINTDGTNFQTIFVEPFYDDADEIARPTWDGNATNIVFLSGPGPSESYPREIFVWQPSKAHYEVCIPYDTILSVEISPDGQKVFYNKGGTLFEMDLDSCEETKIITIDKNQSIFATINWENNDLVVSKVGDDELLYIPHNQPDPKKAFYLTNGTRPAFSPDGQWISFIRNDGIYVINIDGSSERLLFSRLYDDFESENRLTPYPRWSPDGQYLVFHDCEKSWCDSRPDGYGIYMINVETLEKTHIISNGISPYWRWSE